MRFSANTGFLFKELPFLERIAAAARAGFDAVEFHDEWRHESEDDIRTALRDAGLPLLGLNTRMEETAGCAAVPGKEGRAREDAEAAIAMARALGGTGVHVMAGKVEPNAEAMDAYRANLAHACHAAGELAILIEPLCTKAMPVYPLRTAGQAASLIEEIGAPNLRIMFDIFHVAGEGDDILATYREHASRVGHVQLADPDTRHEPSTKGEHAIGPLLWGIVETGYSGAFGCEYVPRGPVGEGLSWKPDR